MPGHGADGQQRVVAQHAQVHGLLGGDREPVQHRLRDTGEPAVGTPGDQ
ncbi:MULTISPECIES: hypothetical protein [Pseudonocardia]|nr:MULTISPECIES: hypothetical protein [Pseudonocardia]